MMENMEDDKKVAGWGFKPKAVEGKNDEEKFNAMQDNLQKAIQNMEKDDILAKGNEALHGKQERLNDEEAKKGNVVEKKTDVNTEQVLAATNMVEESMEDRKNRLDAYKNKLIEERENERKENLMRTSFFQVQKEVIDNSVDLEEQIQ